MRNIGLIGLGPMGLSILQALIDNGYRVLVYDIEENARSRGQEIGAQALLSARAVAEASELVLTSLPGPAQVRDVALNAAHGVLGGLREGVCMVDLSTCGPDTAMELSEAFVRAGRKFIDCPVSGKPPSLTVLVGSAQNGNEPWQQVIESIALKTFYCGKIGSGYAVKLLNQHIKYAWYLASCEALIAAEEYGINPALAADAIAGSSGSDSGFLAAASYFRSDDAYIDSRAPLSTLAKDLELARAMTAAAGVACPTLSVVADFFTAANKTPFSGRPYPLSTELLKMFRRASTQD